MNKIKNIIRGNGMMSKLNVLSFALLGALFLFGCIDGDTHEKANTLFREGKYDEAAVVYDAILKKSPNDLVSLKATADIKLRKKEFPGAIERYKRVIEMDPSQGIVEIVSMFSYSKNIRDLAADTIRDLSNGRTEVIGEIMKQMEAGNNYLKIDYLNVLTRIGGGASLSAEFVSKYLDDEYFEIRKSALEALGTFDVNKLKEVGAIDKMVQCLKDENDSVTKAAIRSLGALKAGANETVPSIIDMLAKPEFRDAAKQSVADIGPAAKSTVAALVALAADNKKVEIVRITAIDSLSAMGTSANDAVADLIPLLQDSNNIIKTAAANALMKIGKPSVESVPELIKLLKNKDMYIKLRAITELSEMGKAASAALAPLERLSKDTGKDSSKELRKEAQQAYEKISRAKR
jgi:HEAT repeat protein